MVTAMRLSAQERSSRERRAIDRDALYGRSEQVTEVGAVAGDVGIAIQSDCRAQHRFVLVVDWQTARALIAAMEREDPDLGGQCIESGKRCRVSCEQVPLGFFPNVCVRNQLVVRFVQTSDEPAHGAVALGSGEQDIRIQEYPHLTGPLAPGIEFSRQFRL